MNKRKGFCTSSRLYATTTTETTPSNSSSNSNINNDRRLETKNDDVVVFGSSVDEDDEKKSSLPTEKALTGTVNERLMAELQEAKTEPVAPRSKLGQKLRLEAFKSTKTDEERAAAIAEARNLNGVNPFIAFTASLFAMGIGVGLWYVTSFLAGYFGSMSMNTTDLYIVQRATAVFRNVVMGLVSLASGFFGVTGFGIFLLSIRVAYGVMTGELDPTPIARKTNDDNDSTIQLGKIWELMTDSRKAAGRRGRKQ